MLSSWLVAEMQRRVDGGPRGYQRDLAKQVGLSPSLINRVYKGDLRRLSVESAERLLDAFGGDIARALPDVGFVREDPGGVYAGATMRVEGQVSAGEVRMAGTRRREVRADPQAWRGSRLWGMTHGEVVFLEVEGDSMAPEYETGDLIACRAPVNPRDLPNRTPCVFRDGGDRHTFKLLMRPTNSTAVLAQPINPAYAPLLFKPHEVLHVDFVVLGKLRVR